VPVGLDVETAGLGPLAAISSHGLEASARGGIPGVPGPAL